MVECELTDRGDKGARVATTAARGWRVDEADAHHAGYRARQPGHGHDLGAVMPDEEPSLFDAPCDVPAQFECARTRLGGELRGPPAEFVQLVTARQTTGAADAVG